MMLTTVLQNPNTHSLRALVAKIFPSLQWRHHGIGVLQAYVAENVEPEIRVHVWSRKLLKPGMDESGDIHDHRFMMVSHVLTGVVGHEEVIPEVKTGGGWRMMQLTHARAAKESAYHGPTTELPGEFDVRTNTMFIPTGHSYRYPAQRFHRSPLPLDDERVAVTVVEKWQQSDAPARILYPIDKPPVMAFGHDMDFSLVAGVLAKAMAALQP